MTLKRTLLVLVLAVLVWANWQAPEMHHFVQPADTVVWQVQSVDSPAVAQALEAKLSATPGVAACAVSWRTSCVSFVYHPSETTQEALYQAVNQAGAKVITHPSVAADSAIRQCPVPPGYALLLDRFRFALNVRRFFVGV